MEIILTIINTIILSITAILLWIYTKATQDMKGEMMKQTQLEQMPIMLMFVRNINDYKTTYGDLQKLRDKNRNFLIRIRTDQEDSDYIVRLRNTGKGTAFNVKVESDIFDIIDYETRFFAPQTDEHAIKLIQKGNQKIENWEMFENSIFNIKCKDVVGNEYIFKYKIIDFKNREIEYQGSL